MITEVVAALIWDGDRFLACQRPAHKDRGLLWEFAGGKVEPDETKEEALRRECREELGIELSVRGIFTEVTHTYPDLTIHLTLFHASITQGEPRLLEHNALRWVTVREMDSLPFCPADQVILDRLRLWAKGRIDSQLVRALRRERDEGYQAFHRKLIPAVDPERIIGVRTPALRRVAASFEKTPDCQRFLVSLPHWYYEENNVHGCLISRMKDPEAVLEALDRFLPYVDNWATCDMIVPKVFRQRPEALLLRIRQWLASDHPYTVRFGVGMLMRFYLDEGFQPAYLEWVASIRSHEYYVKMMVAWYFATALFKQYASALPYLEERKLEKWTHNKTIQKAEESNRISQERKNYLRKLKNR